jgi:hypothetical protein
MAFYGLFFIILLILIELGLVSLINWRQKSTSIDRTPGSSVSLNSDDLFISKPPFALANISGEEDEDVQQERDRISSYPKGDYVVVHDLSKVYPLSLNILAPPYHFDFSHSRRALL